MVLKKRKPRKELLYDSLDDDSDANAECLFCGGYYSDDKHGQASGSKCTKYCSIFSAYKIMNKYVLFLVDLYV